MDIRAGFDQNFDVDSYLSCYKGRTIIDRLMLICESVKYNITPEGQQLSIIAAKKGIEFFETNEVISSLHYDYFLSHLKRINSSINDPILSNFINNHSSNWATKLTEQTKQNMLTLELQIKALIQDQHQLSSEKIPNLRETLLQKIDELSSLNVLKNDIPNSIRIINRINDANLMIAGYRTIDSSITIHKISQIHLSDKNWNGVLAQSKRFEQICTETILSNNFTDEQKNIVTKFYWKLEIYSIISLFCKKLYLDSITRFLKLLEDENFEIFLINEFDNELNNNIINLTKDDLLLFMTLSALSSLSLNELKLLNKNLSFKLLIDELNDNTLSNELNELLLLYTTSNFKIFLKKLHMNEIIISYYEKNNKKIKPIDCYLSKVYDHLLKLIRERVYIQFLTPFKRISSKQIVQCLNLNALIAPQVTDEILALIKVLKLNLRYDVIDEVFSFVNNDSKDKNQERLFNKLEDTIGEVEKAVKIDTVIGSIIGSAKN